MNTRHVAENASNERKYSKGEKMGKAARAIIIENGQILVMKRIKQGNEYYTLVGGQLSEGESAESALVREVKEETGFDVVSHKLVFVEHHPEPYNSQAIYLCEIAPHGKVEVQPNSEEGVMNRLDINVHEPQWIDIRHFGSLAFTTMQLQKAIVNALQNGFPEEPIAL